MKKPPVEINNAILILEKNLKKCIQYNCFGHDNKKQLSSMIDVLKFDRSKIWIMSNYLSVSEFFHEQPDNVLWRSAMDARDWLDGCFELEDLLFEEA